MLHMLHGLKHIFYLFLPLLYSFTLRIIPQRILRWMKFQNIQMKRYT